MELYRYSIRREDKYELKETDRLIKIWKKNDKYEELGKILFTTPWVSNDSDEQNNRLCITYYPQWRSKVKIEPGMKFLNNDKYKINLSTDVNTIPRTWPAFGKDGGVPEVLISADNVKFDEFSEIPNGGAFEMWHQDQVTNYELPLKIIGIFRDALISEEFGTEIRGEDERSFPAIIKDGNAIINSKLPNGQDYVTLSAAYSIIAGILYIKIWAAYWNENIQQRIRRIWYESTYPIKLFPCLIHHRECLWIYYFEHCSDQFQVQCGSPITAIQRRDNFEKCLKEYYSKSLEDKTTYQYLQIFDATIKLLEGIKNISSGFFMNHSRCVVVY
ncbi:MAG: hypothetical protein ACP5FQ_07250 [Thermoplasmata archaeon]